MQKLLQIKEYLLELSFSALLIRTLFLGAGIGEALAFISLVISICYKSYLAKSEVKATSDMQKQLDEMSSKINSLSMDRLRKNNEQEARPASIAKRLF
jgi:hypothetical protein